MTPPPRREWVSGIFPGRLAAGGTGVGLKSRENAWSALRAAGAATPTASFTARCGHRRRCKHGSLYRNEPSAATLCDTPALCSFGGLLTRDNLLLQFGQTPDGRMQRENKVAAGLKRVSTQQRAGFLMVSLQADQLLLASGWDRTSIMPLLWTPAGPGDRQTSLVHSQIHRCLRTWRGCRHSGTAVVG